MEFRQAHASCAGCIEATNDWTGAPALGVLVPYAAPRIRELDVGGCVAIVDGNETADGCGAAFEAWLDCTMAECAACPADPAAIDACQRDARACDAYVTAACRKEAQSEPVLSACFGGENGSAHDTFFAIGTTLCASAAADAGARGATDASDNDAR